MHLNTFWKHGAHLTRVTSDRLLLEAILGVSADNSSTTNFKKKKI